MTDFHIVIPARFASTRLPGKLMLEIAGMTVLERVYRQALKAHPSSITIATDSMEIAQHARDFGAAVVMTGSHHQTGTDRLVEVMSKEHFAKEAIIVNVQGDEPFIAPELIQQVAENLQHNTHAVMATLCWPITSQEQWHNPNVVKVVCDNAKHALYFSRSPIPAARDKSHDFSLAFRHIGLYAYRADFLRQYSQLPFCALEQSEALEQLRVLAAGYKIQVDKACVMPLQDINTAEDLQAARELIGE